MKEISFIDLINNPVIATLISSTVGAITGGFIAYYFGVKLSKRNEKLRAAINLKDAFSKELALLDPKLGDKKLDAVEILESALPQHLAAVTEFEVYLNRKKRAKFREAWIEYYSANGDDRCTWFTQYQIGDGCRDLLKKRINNILSFTGLVKAENS